MLFLANIECCPQFLEYALEGSLLFAKVPRNSWCWFDWPLKDEMLSWPWSHPVILNLGPLDWKFSTLTTRPLHHVRVSSNLKTTEPDFFKKSCFGIFGPKGLEMKCWVFMKNQHMEFFWFFALSYSNISPAVELNDFRVKNPFFCCCCCCCCWGFRAKRGPKWNFKFLKNWWLQFSFWIQLQ